MAWTIMHVMMGRTSVEGAINSDNIVLAEPVSDGTSLHTLTQGKIVITETIQEWLEGIKEAESG